MIYKKKYFIPLDESLRPVIIVGPLNEAVVDQLEQDFPHVFQRCIPEKMKGSLSMMERGLQELKFVDFRRRGNHFECTTVAAIKQLCDKVSHTNMFKIVFSFLIKSQNLCKILGF